MKRQNPYAATDGADGRWLRGSFHGHCDENSPCASVPLAEGVLWFYGDDVQAWTRPQEQNQLPV